MWDERLPIVNEEGFDHIAVSPPLDALKSLIDEIRIECLFHNDLNLIIQPGLSVLSNPCRVCPRGQGKILLCLIAILPVSKTTWMVQCPGDGAVVVIVFNSKPEDHCSLLAGSCCI